MREPYGPTQLPALTCAIQALPAVCYNEGLLRHKKRGSETDGLNVRTQEE